MDELKLLIEMVAGLPALAVWVLVGYLIYKIVVIGSIYGLIRLVIERLYSWLVSPIKKTVEARIALDGLVINGAMNELIAQLMRIRRGSSYVHRSEVVWLREAIDDKEAKDALNQK